MRGNATVIVLVILLVAAGLFFVFAVQESAERAEQERQQAIALLEQAKERLEQMPFYQVTLNRSAPLGDRRESVLIDVKKDGAVRKIGETCFVGPINTTRFVAIESLLLVEQQKIAEADRVRMQETNNVTRIHYDGNSFTLQKETLLPVFPHTLFALDERRATLDLVQFETEDVVLFGCREMAQNISALCNQFEESDPRLTNLRDNLVARGNLSENAAQQRC